MICLLYLKNNAVYYIVYKISIHDGPGAYSLALNERGNTFSIIKIYKTIIYKNNSFPQ